MIRKFTSNDTSDPLVQFLLLTDDERTDAAIPIDQLRAKAKEESAKQFQTYAFVKDCDILSQKHCDMLCAFLEYMWYSTASDCPNDRVDMRLQALDEPFLELLGALDREFEEDSRYQSDAILSRLHCVYHKIPDSVANRYCPPDVSLRTTRGPTNTCINFNCDGVYASSTSQISLNDSSEYKGGRLCFFVSDKLHILEERPVGSLTQHPPRVLHAVTSLTEGTRKSLFIADNTNDMIRMTSKDVRIFLAAQISPATDRKRPAVDISGT
jgi:hypothetical protein